MGGADIMKSWYRNLTEFIEVLEQAGELVRVRTPVSPELEITEITDRECKKASGGKALLFECVEGSQYPVITNAFGSFRRIAMALGCEDIDDLAGRLHDILDQAPPATIMDKLSFLPKLLMYAQFLPKISSRRNPPCQEVILTGDRIDLTELPVLKCWPLDGGPFVTLPVVFTKGLKDKRRNVGMYRMQIFDKKTTGMHWHIHKDASGQYAQYRKAGRKMEVAVAIGTDPAVTYAATAPLPPGVDEMLLAGFIRKRPVELVKGITVDIEVPAEAEFVIEGYVDPQETRMEGPFGDHTGYYSLQDEYPVLHVTAITHRNDPVYSATVVGRPPMEDCYLAYATERLFLPLLKTILPEIKDYRLPWEGVFHNIVVVAVDKRYPAHASRIINALWGTGQMSFSKAIVIVDDEALLKNGRALMTYILDNIDLHRDIILSEGILDVLDHSAPQPLCGAKIGIDATQRVAGEQSRSCPKASGPLQDELVLLETLGENETGFLNVRIAFAGCTRPLILINIEKKGKSSQCFKDRVEALDVTGIMVLFDSDINLADDSLLLWKVFNNVDPVRDILLSGNKMIIDATRKGMADGHTRPWPDDIVMSEEIRRLVDRKMPNLVS